MDNIKFGKLIKKLRKENNLTQEELGEILHVTNKAVSKWERGESIPDIAVLEEISNHFQIGIKELLDGEEISNLKTNNKGNLEENIESVSKFNNTRKIISTVVGILLLLIVILIISLAVIFAISNKNENSGSNSKSQAIIENNLALVPDRMVYKNETGDYFIFSEIDSDFNKIYNIVTSNLKYKNNGQILSLNEIEELKEEYSFIEFDYNTKSKNRIFLIDCPNIAMINMTGEQGQVVREKIDNADEITKLLKSVTALRENFNVKYNLEVDEIIEEFPENLDGFSEKIHDVKFKVVDYDELKSLVEKYSIDIDVDHIDFEARSVIVTFHNKEYISRVDKCIGHLSYYISPNIGFNHLNIQIFSKIYNSNCVYFYTDNSITITESSDYIDEPIDATNKAIVGNFTGCGTIEEVSNNIIYFRTKEEKYYLTNNENLNFINERTLEILNIDDIETGDFISFFRDGTVYICKNITGEILKKQLLKNLSFDYQDSRWIYPAINLISVQKTGENEGIIAVEIDDFISSNEYYNGTDEKFHVELKVTPTTTYHSKGGNIYDIDTLKYAIGNINDLRLDKSTIEDEYPVVIEFNSTDN